MLHVLNIWRLDVDEIDNACMLRVQKMCMHIYYQLVTNLRCPCDLG